VSASILAPWATKLVLSTISEELIKPNAAVLESRAGKLGGDRELVE